MPNQRRILTDLRIDELSSVDRPAQEGAVAVLQKRRPTTSLALNLPDSVTAEDRRELLGMLAQLEASTDAVVQGLLRSLIASRLAQLGVTALKSDEDEE